MASHSRPKPGAMVNWMEWGEEAFLKAREEDKPILLAIGAVWCHWCHVMDNTTYSDPNVVEIINRDFIPIRVDNDKRPDINDRYNQGGWPTTAFLTPDGELIAGATYIPPPQMEKVLKEVKRLASNLPGKRALMAMAHSRVKRPISEPKRVRPMVVEATWEGLWHFYDPVHGGFGKEPKFPMVDALGFALYGYHERRDGRLLKLVTHTLDKMGGGGVYDPVEGGFFRYSVTRDWSIPHYEKMLEDNAGLVSLYLDVFRITREPRFKEKAQHALSYLLTRLYDPERGVFWGSQDADEEYYKLNRDERSKREAPRIDRTIYTNWNAMMVSTLLKAQIVLEGDYSRKALRCLSFLLDNCYRPEMGAYHYFDGEAKLPGLIRDQVWLTHALLDAYQFTGEAGYLEKARELADWSIKNLWDPREGGFFDIPFKEGALGALSSRLKGIQENAHAALSSIKLDVLFPTEGYRQYAEGAITCVDERLEGYGPFTASLAQAADLFLKTPIRVDVTGDRGDPRTQALISAALKDYGPRKLVSYQMSDDIPKAVICEGNICRGPYLTPEDLRLGLQSVSPSYKI